MGRCPTQAALPLVRLAAEKVIRDRYKQNRLRQENGLEELPVPLGPGRDTRRVPPGATVG
ncbi:MAG: hypothetical protein R6U98_25730 [Pirellulaceae bacterium]